MPSCGNDGTPECPLCCAELDLTDRSIKYCECGYQMCLWCYHHILEEAGKENLPARCPNCRNVYDQNKIQIQHIDAQMLAEEKRKLKGKDKPRVSLAKSRANLANVRVVQPNLVYVVGLPLEVCHEEPLRQPEYFGQFGRIVKISVNRASGIHSTAKHGATGSAYVTFRNCDDALRCIQTLDGTTWHSRPVKACFGTTKYCNAFLKGMSCNNPECLYLHEVADESDCLTKEEVAAGMLPARFAAMGASNTFRPRVGPAATTVIARSASGTSSANPPASGGMSRSPSVSSLPATQRLKEVDPADNARLTTQPLLVPPPPPPPPPLPQPTNEQAWPELAPSIDVQQQAPVVLSKTTSNSLPFEHEFPSLGPTNANTASASTRVDAAAASTTPLPRKWAATAAGSDVDSAGAATSGVSRRSRGGEAGARGKKLVPLASPGRIKPLSPPPSMPKEDAGARINAGERTDEQQTVARPTNERSVHQAPLTLSPVEHKHPTTAAAPGPALPPGFESWDPMRSSGGFAFPATRSTGASSLPEDGALPPPGYVPPPPGIFAPLPRPPGLVTPAVVPVLSGRMQSRFAFAQEPGAAAGSTSGLVPPPPPQQQPSSLPANSGMALLQQLRAASSQGAGPGGDSSGAGRPNSRSAPAPPPGFDVRL